MFSALAVPLKNVAKGNSVVTNNHSAQADPAFAFFLEAEVKFSKVISGSTAGGLGSLAFSR